MRCETVLCGVTFSLISSIVLAQSLMVNIHRLAGDPEGFDGKQVSVKGYMRQYSDEYYVLFYSEMHARMDDNGNAILVRNSWQHERGFSLEYCHDGYVEVDGIVGLRDGYPYLESLLTAGSMVEGDDGSLKTVPCLAE